MYPPLRPKPYVYVVSAVTVTYLLIELSFNARLLDVTGSDASPEVVHSIEHWGRALSGTALALGILGTWLLPAASKHSWRWWVTSASVAVCAGLCLLIMWQVQTALINYFVDHSSGDTRRTAFRLKFVERSAIQQKVEISGIPLTPALMVSPEGKSFLSLLPFMASSVDGIDAKLDTGLAALIRAQVAERMGSPQVLFEGVFHTSVEKVREYYNLYAQACNEYVNALDTIPARQSEAWSTYEKELSQHGYTPQNVPAMGWDRVRSMVQSRGVAVPANWHPSDKPTFMSAIAHTVQNRADSTYNEKMREKAGEVLPKGLSRDQFEALPRVQTMWREQLKLPVDTKLSYRLNGQAFVDAVYNPLLDAQTKEYLNKYTDTAADYADGGLKQQDGRMAMTVLVVPPIALTFSLAGALLHIFKTSNYLSLLGLALLPRLPAPAPVVARMRTIVILSSTVVIFLAAFALPNAVTKSKLYGFFEEQLIRADGIAPALTCRWVIQAQHYFWPINERLREVVMRGYEF